MQGIAALGPLPRRALPLVLPTSPFRSLPVCTAIRTSHYSTVPIIAPAVPFRTHIGPLPSSTSDPLTPNAHVFWHAPTSTWTYVVVCPTTKHCVIIDPALDYDSTTQTISTESADSLLSFIREQGYKVDKILESHAHADHLTSARYLQLKLAKGEGRSVETGIGEKIRQTQEYFAKKYELRSEELEGAFDKLWKDEEKFTVGECVCEVMHLPGHTVSSPCSRERLFWVARGHG